MDGSIRQIIQFAQHAEEASAVKLVVQAYKYLQQAFSKSKSDESDCCGTDLYVECAEVAFKLKQVKISQECLQMYFDGTPLTNQFLCRAYLCQALLLSPKSADDLVSFETSVIYLLKAINFAKDISKYQFIVYNASVLYWQMSRPFLRDGYKAVLQRSLSQVVKALESSGDSDHEWRASLMIALIESYVDGGNMKEASTAAQAAAQFTLNNMPDKYKDVLTLQVKHRLVDLNKLAKEVNSMPEVSAFYKLQKIRFAAIGKSKKDVAAELQKLVAVVSGKVPLPSSKSGSRESRGRGALDDVIVQPDDRPKLLIDLCRLCIDSQQVTLAKHCLTALKECDISDSSLSMEMELLDCELLVEQLGDRQESYTHAAIEVRMAAIKRMDQALQNAMRSSNANLVQGACTIQWNLCLPLLQRDLRHLVRRPLNRVAQALEDISSLHILLRCQVHTELARCEEAVEQIEAAVKHLNKAMQLDDTGLYHERLHTMAHRLQLSTQLYRAPDRPEDIAAIIIEQARKSSDSGSTHMKRSLLVKAGLSLAPDAFQFVLDSENALKVLDAVKAQRENEELKAQTGSKILASSVGVLAARASQWKKCMKKAAGHLKRLGNENDRERTQLWVDLVKTARQQHVWDVCRVAAAFCLLYDDGRWKAPTKDALDVDAIRDKSTTHSAKNSTKTPTDDEEKGVEFSFSNTDLLRMLAEVCCINGEALIHLLSSMGLMLNESPVRPCDERLQMKQHSSAEDAAWHEYTDWTHQLNHTATNSFLRAIELGVELGETWLVCSGAVYLWNYNKHLISMSNFTQLVPTFEKILFGLQRVGHASEASLLVRICDVIAKGLLTPWLPKKVLSSSKDAEQVIATAATTKESSRKKTGGKGAAVNAPVADLVAVDPEANDDLKKALIVCEYGLQVTNGAKARDRVATEIRHQLLSTWVLLKQMLHQQIAPNYTVEFEKVASQQQMMKALVMLQMLLHNSNKQLMEFSVPELNEVVDVVNGCEWDDAGVELEAWTELLKLAHGQKSHSLVLRCSKNALDLERSAVVKRSTENSSAAVHKRITALEMLSRAACVLGESLMDTCASNPSARRQAMQNFLNSATFGKQADNINLVMLACRHWWNAALPLIPSILERELLRQPLEILLKSILHVSKNAGNNEENIAPEKEAKHADDSTSATKSGNDGPAAELVFDDTELRAAMYGLLFQTYADKGAWEEGLAVMDWALMHMPRTKHRQLLFKHRVIVKAKLGKDVQMDIAKFKDESEEYVSHMWHRVALCSRNALEQLSGFQQAIEALHSDETRWQKFEYLLELGTWLFTNEFPLCDAINVVEWACDILFNMRFEVETKEEKHVDKKKGKKGKAANFSSRAALGSRTVSSAKSGKKTEEKQQEYKPEEKLNPVIPTEKEVVIGVEANNPDMKIEDLGSTRQLEGLIRAYTMMATMCGQSSSKKHILYCELAYCFVIRLWKIALASAGSIIKQHPKPSTTADGDRKVSGKKGQKATPVTTERPKRKGPLDAVPSSTSEWAVYDPPDEVKRVFVLDESDCGINKQTITCAGMAVHYLLKLSDFLRESSRNHLALPVLSLAAVITQVVLQSSSWTQLIHMIQVVVCYELHLESAASHWEEVLGEKFLLEEEQMVSKQNLDLKQIHKDLAKQEEGRIRQANADESIPKDLSDSSKVDSDGTGLPGPTMLMGRKVGHVNMGEIWLEKAKILLLLGQYQSSRSLLSEALTIALDSDDKYLKAEIYHGFADLMIREGNIGQAIQMIRNAQLIGGDVEFWKNNIYLLVDAIRLNQDSSPEDLALVSKVVCQAVDCLNKLQAIRPTKTSALEYLKATLQAHDSFMRIASRKCNLDEQFKKLQQAENILEEHGHFRKLASIHTTHAELLVDLSKSTDDEQHFNLLQAVLLLNRSSSNLSSVYNDVLGLESDKEVSLPVFRELMSVELELVKTLLQSASLSTIEERQAVADEQGKGELESKVEKYIGKMNENQSEADELWEAERKSFFHRSFFILNQMHTSVPKNHMLSAKWLHLFGVSLRLTGESLHSHPSSYQWNIASYLSDTYSEDNEENNCVSPQQNIDVEEGGEDVGNELLKKKQLQSCHGKNILVQKCERAHRYLSHATEALAQSLSLSLLLHSYDTTSGAASDFLECCGQFDTHITSRHLALKQSAEWSLCMKTMLQHSLSDPATSQFAALLNQVCWLMRNHVKTGLHNSSLRKNIMKVLDENYVAWKRLTLSLSPFNLTKDLPHAFNIAILQHSNDRKFLYCACLDKPKPQVTSNEGKAKGKEKPVASPAPSRAFVSRSIVDGLLYQELAERHPDHQLRLMSFLLQNEYQIYQQAMRNQMLLQLSKSTTDVGISESTLEDQAEEQLKLKEEFLDILSQMEEYLHGAASVIKANLVQPIAAQAKEYAANGVTVAEPDFVILLLDADLMKLPLEALQCLKSRFLTSVSRDFSMQMMLQRWLVGIDEVDHKKTDLKTAPKTAKAGKDGAGRKATPTAKVMPLNREVPSGCHGVNTHSVHYIVDPHDESSETEQNKPEELFRSILQIYSQQFTPRWSGVFGTDQTPSTGQCESLLQDCSAFIYYGMERFIAQCPATKMLSLKLDNCQLTILLDKAQTHESFRRQSKVDVDKSNGILSTEKPLETAVFLSLSGVNAICLNQWHASLEDNSSKLRSLMSDLLEGGRFLGQAVHKLGYFYLPNEEKKAEVADDEDGRVSPLDKNSSSDEMLDKQSTALCNTVLFGLPNLIFV